MNKSLRNIIWQRHKWLLIVGLLAIVGSYTQSLVTQYTTWKNTYDYYQSTDYKEMFEQEVKENLDNGLDGAVYYVQGEDQEKYTKDFDVYKENDLNDLKMFEGPYASYGLSYYGYLFYSLISLLTIFYGLAVFLYDNNGNFNQTWFSSRFTKKQIFWSKLNMFSAVFFGSHMIGTAIYLFGMYSLIPSQFMGIGLTEILPSAIASILLGGCYYFVSVLAGIIMGQWLFAIPTVMAFVLSVSFFTATLNEWFIVFSGQYDAYRNGHFYEEVNQLPSWVMGFTNQKVPVSQWISMLVIISLCLLASNWLFKRMTTDNAHQYLAFDFLKKPVLIAAMCYIFFSVFSIPVYSTLVYEKLGTILWMFVIVILVMVLVYLVFYYLIYRQLPFSGKKKTFQ